MDSDMDEFAKENYFVKDYPWEYGREFRILIINKTETDYPYLYIDIPKMSCSCPKILVAPEYQNQTGGNKLNLPEDHITPENSSLKISMNLCRKNAPDLFAYIVKRAREIKRYKITEIHKKKCSLRTL